MHLRLEPSNTMVCEDLSASCSIVLQGLGLLTDLVEAGRLGKLMSMVANLFCIRETF